MEATLTSVEVSSLSKHERTIERGMATFVEVGTALAAIRDAKLYRDSHKTFEAYCKDRWGWDRQRAYQMISAADAATDVKHVLQKPENPRQAAALAQAPKELREEIWEQVIETAPNGKVTAKHVEETVATFLEEDDDDGADEPVRKTATSKPAGVSFADRKNCINALTALVKACRAVGIYDEVEDSLAVIKTAIAAI